MVPPLSNIPSGQDAGGNLSATPNCNAGAGRVASRNRRFPSRNRHFREKIHLSRTPVSSAEMIWDDWLSTWYE